MTFKRLADSVLTLTDDERKRYGGFKPAEDLEVDLDNLPVPRRISYCTLQSSNIPAHQLAHHIAGCKLYGDHGPQVFTGIEWGMAHLNYWALTDSDPSVADGALNYYEHIHETFGLRFTEAACHPDVMTALAPPSTLNFAHKLFVDQRIWRTKSGSQEPDVEEMRKVLINEALPRMAKATKILGGKRVIIFVGSSRAAIEVPQFPHPTALEREEKIGEDFEFLDQVERIGKEFGIVFVIEHHPEQIFHTPEELAEFAVRFMKRGYKHVKAKLDGSHLLMTFCDPGKVIHKVTKALHGHVRVINIALLSEKIGATAAMQVYDVIEPYLLAGKTFSPSTDFKKDVGLNPKDAAALLLAKAIADGYTGVGYEPFFGSIHLKGAGVDLSGVQSTHSKLSLSNDDLERASWFEAIHRNASSMFRRQMAQIAFHGLGADWDAAIEHEDDWTTAVTLGLSHPGANDLFNAGRFAMTNCSFLTPIANHQALMAGKTTPIIEVADETA